MPININMFVKRIHSSDESNTKKVQFSKLLDNSSIHIFSKLSHSKKKNRKGLWIFVLLVLLIGCINQVNKIVRLYVQFPVVVNFQIEQLQSSDFPAVTICNQNRVNSKFAECLGKGVNFDGCVVQVLWNEKFPKDSVKSDDRQPFPMPERKLMPSCVIKKLDAKLYSRFKFLSLYSQLSDNQRLVIGHQQFDIIKSCSFNGWKCSIEDFKVVRNLRYGNCFTFTQRNMMLPDGSSSPTVLLPKGLELELNTELFNYISETQVTGLRVVIHDSNEDSSPDQSGVNISPGFETTIGLVQSQTKRLPYPYKDNCVMYGTDTESRYTSQDACLRRCIQERSLSNCGCTDLTLPAIDEGEHCNLRNVTQMCCLDKSLKDLIEEGFSCACLQPCVSTNYKAVISRSVWPSKAYFMKKKLSYPHFIDTKLNEYKRSHAKLKVVYSTLGRRSFVKTPKFHDSELLSNLGGELGLWLGFSMFAIFELGEILYRLTCLTICSKLSKVMSC